MDIYAVGATFYIGITGFLPIEAVKRYVDSPVDLYQPLANNPEYLERFPQHALSAIDKALSFRASDRFQDCMDFQYALMGMERPPDLQKIEEFDILSSPIDIPLEPLNEPGKGRWGASKIPLAAGIVLAVSLSIPLALITSSNLMSVLLYFADWIF
jgi:hypothetical protein